MFRPIQFISGRLHQNLIANYIFTNQFRANGRRSEGADADIVDFRLCDGLLCWQTQAKQAMRINVTVLINFATSDYIVNYIMDG